ncbi:MAG: hypothetical protein HOP30_17280 [Cyclobacteriaceae bacterium]|nr:hypothetical protein [Cyclobacteriaceae bacterium]
MENKNELLEKLGYSKEYLMLLNKESKEINSQEISTADDVSVHQIVDNKVTSFIIEKTDLPINNHFIFNER